VILHDGAGGNILVGQMIFVRMELLTDVMGVEKIVEALEASASESKRGSPSQRV